MFHETDFDYENPEDSPPDLDRFYGNLKHYVRMVCQGYSNLLMLDARGGLGKTHNVRQVLAQEQDDEQWLHQKGFTTPIELYKTLWLARDEDTVLFLDDMSGVTNNTKAIDMLKAATDTEGDENWVEYRTSQDIDHPTVPGATLPNTFCFRGTIIMSFNDTPDNRHFDALQDRGTFYQLSLNYQERIELIREMAKIGDFSSLPVPTQQELAEWVETVTSPAHEVTLRTFLEVCQMYDYGQNSPDADWERMALEVFDLDYHQYLIWSMRQNTDLSVEEQIDTFKEKTGMSQGYYYDCLGELKDEMD